MPSAKIKRDLESFRAELAKLRAMSYTKVSELPEYSEIPGASTDKKHTVGRYKDNLENGAIRVVLQSYRYRFLGMGSIYAEGFIFDSGGNVTEVGENELWSFM